MQLILIFVYVTIVLIFVLTDDANEATYSIEHVIIERTVVFKTFADGSVVVQEFPS